MEFYGPAAVLINRRHECLFSIGPTDRYLHVVQGHPSHDLLAMAPEEMRTKLRAAIQQASQERSRIVVIGRDIAREDIERTFAAFDYAARPRSTTIDPAAYARFVEAMRGFGR